MSASRKFIKVFTDGACRGNPGKGGWAWVMFSNPPRHEKGSDPYTTNNIMELSALKMFLQHNPPGNYEVNIDSQYVLKGLCSELPQLYKPSKDRHLTGWIMKWKVKKYTDVKNAELWKSLDTLLTGKHASSYIKFAYVKGHSGDPGNDLADKFACEAADASSDDEM